MATVPINELEQQIRAAVTAKRLAQAELDRLEKWMTKVCPDVTDPENWPALGLQAEFEAWQKKQAKLDAANEDDSVTQE